MTYQKNAQQTTLAQQQGGSVGIIVVTYGNEVHLPRLLRILAKEKQKGDQIIIFDNHPKHACADIAEKSVVVDTVVRSENIGFGAACNAAVAMLDTQTDLIVLLNPDVIPRAGAVTKLRAAQTHNWSAWMGLLLLPDGTINSAGNTVHISGLSWCGDLGKPASNMSTRSVNALSGACMAVRRSVWNEMGGLPEGYFLYYEDTDFSFSLRQRGLTLGMLADAQFTHKYEFNRGVYKWYYLERNRYIFIIRQWPMGVIIGLIPILIPAEIGLWVISIAQRRFLSRLRAVSAVIGEFPALLRERRTLRQKSGMPNSEFVQLLSGSLASPVLGRVANIRSLNWLFLNYLRGLHWTIKLISSR